MRAGASANAFGISDPNISLCLIAQVAQNIRAPACSRNAAYVLANVTLPFCLGLPFAT